MSVGDIFRTKEYKSKIKQLETENELMQKLIDRAKEVAGKKDALLNEASKELFAWQEKYDSQAAELAALQASITEEIRNAIDMNELLDIMQSRFEASRGDVARMEGEAERLSAYISQLQDEVLTLEEVKLLQDFNLYEPTYSFSRSEEYKERLDECRLQQKQLIKAKTAVRSSFVWAANGDKSQGKKMIESVAKQCLMCFNTECDNIISKVKFNNFDKAKESIKKAYDKINKLCEEFSVFISEDYLNLKIIELILAFEYQRKKQEEKEYEREQRAIARENAKVQRELEEQREKLEKEKAHYNNLMLRLKEQMEAEQSEARKEFIAEKIAAASEELVQIDKAIADVDYRRANERAGYVYVISNIGAFGENVYKIGMTRRLEPLDRIDELGGASVPFRFDVHAMIFSNDAPKLETALHNAFADRRVNMINSRKEFFRVSLKEIEEVVRNNHDKSVEFNYVATAQQYRESMKMLEAGY